MGSLEFVPLKRLQFLNGVKISVRWISVKVYCNNSRNGILTDGLTPLAENARPK